MSKMNFMKTMRVPTGPFNKDNKLSKNQKDAGWNNRFHIDKIPSYNAFNDQNSKIYQVKLRSILKSLNSKPSKKSFSPAKATSNYEDLLKMDNRTITNKFYKDMNRDINKEISEKVHEPISEEMNIIQSMWDDLGVLENYRIIFRYICLELDPTAKKAFLEFELQSLKKLYDFFSKLTKEVQGRERVISLLRQYNNFLENDNISPKLTSDITQTFKNLRILSINIVHIFIQIRELSSYSILCGKYDFDRLNKNFNYERNYLIKMRTDTDFLKQSNLSNYFHIASNISDPFLLSLSQEQTNSNKLTVPLTEEMLNSVKKCQLIILQDQLYYEMNLSMMNQYNNLDFSEISGHQKVQNLKENSKKRGHDKKIQSATIPVFERQHDEFTIKSNIESVKNDQASVNNMKAQVRINSAKKQINDDGIEKNLNDSKIKKNPNQKIEKLDIKIKEKLDKDAKDQRDKDILNIIDIDDNAIEKLIDNRENIEAKEDNKKTQLNENYRTVSDRKLDSKKKHPNENANFSERSIKTDGIIVEKVLQQEVNPTQNSKKEFQSNISKESIHSLNVKETPKLTDQAISTKNKLTSGKDMNQKRKSIEIEEDNVEDEIEEKIKNDEKVKASDKKIEKAAKLGDSNMNEVIDENSNLENNNNYIEFQREERNIDLKQQTQNNDNVKAHQVKEEFEINDIDDEESFHSEKEIKDDKQYLTNKSHSIALSEKSRRESKKAEQNLENVITKEKENDGKLRNEKDNLNINEGKAESSSRKDKSDTKIEKIMKTEESKKHQSIISDTKLSVINANPETVNEAKNDSTPNIEAIHGKNLIKEDNLKEKSNEETLKDNLKPVSQKQIVQVEKNADNLINSKLASKSQMDQINLNKERSIVIKTDDEANKLEDANVPVLTDEKTKEFQDNDKKNEDIKYSDDHIKEEALNEENTVNQIMDNAMIISHDTKFDNIVEKTNEDKKDQFNENVEKILADINEDFPTQTNIIDCQISEISNAEKKVENSIKETDNNNNNQEISIKEEVHYLKQSSIEKKDDKLKELNKNHLELGNKENLDKETNQVKLSEKNIVELKSEESLQKEVRVEVSCNGLTSNKDNLNEEIYENAKLQDNQIVMSKDKELTPALDSLVEENKVNEKNILKESNEDKNNQELNDKEVTNSLGLIKDGRIEEMKIDEIKPDSLIGKKEDLNYNKHEADVSKLNEKTMENIENNDQKQNISLKEVENIYVEQKLSSKKENVLVKKESEIHVGNGNKDIILISNDPSLPKIDNNEVKSDLIYGNNKENQEVKEDLNVEVIISINKRIESKEEEKTVEKIVENPNLTNTHRSEEEIKVQKAVNINTLNEEINKEQQNDINLQGQINQSEIDGQVMKDKKEDIKTAQEIISSSKEANGNTFINKEENIKENEGKKDIKQDVFENGVIIEKEESNQHNLEINNNHDNPTQIQIDTNNKLEINNGAINTNMSNKESKNHLSPTNTDTLVKDLGNINYKEEEILVIEKSKRRIENDVKIGFYTNSFEELQSIFDQYYPKIPEDQLISFKIKRDLKSYLFGNNVKIITIYHQNNMSGICILNFDANTNNFVRVIISHFSTILDNFNEILTILKNFIFRELKFTEIIVNLYYKKLGEKFEIIGNIRDAFKDLLKFRWLKIENTCGERLLVMGLKNDEGSSSYNDNPEFNFALKYNIAYELLKDDGSKPHHQSDTERFLNPLPLIISFANLSVDKGFDVDYEFLKNINNTALHRHYPHFMKVQTEEKTSLINSMKQYLQERDYENFKENAVITNSLVNLAVQFNSIVSSRLQIENNSFYYNRINMEKLEQYTNKELNLKFYNIPFTDDRHSLFIGEIPEASMKEMKLNILTEFFMLKSKLVQSSEENVNIWVPCFDLNLKRNYNKLHYLEEVKISHSNQNYSVFNSLELSEISMKTHSHLHLNCKISPDTQRDIIIKNNFLFAIINIDLATELNLPAVFVEYVKKEQWKY